MTDDFSDPANWHPIEEHPYLNDPPKVTMPDNLRDRIANTLYQELSIELPAAIRGADAVIRELKQEWRADFGYDGYEKCETRDHAQDSVDDFNAALGDDIRDGEQAVVMHRYVTEWTTDE